MKRDYSIGDYRSLRREFASKTIDLFDGSVVYVEGSSI
jgi:hypothetical protein